MVWLVVFLVAAPVIVGFWLARQMNVRPDDALAMRLASELGTPPPPNGKPMNSRRLRPASSEPSSSGRIGPPAMV